MHGCKKSFSQNQVFGNCTLNQSSVVLQCDSLPFQMSDPLFQVKHSHPERLHLSTANFRKNVITRNSPNVQSNICKNYKITVSDTVNLHLNLAIIFVISFQLTICSQAKFLVDGCCIEWMYIRVLMWTFHFHDSCFTALTVNQTIS